VWRPAPAPAPRLRRCRTRRRLDEPRGYRAVRPRRCGHAWGTGSVSRFQPGLSPRRHRQCLRGRGGLDPGELLRAQHEEAAGLIHDPVLGVNLLAGCRARARRGHAHATGIRERSRSESRKPDSIRVGLWRRAWCSFRPTGERLKPFHQVGHRDHRRDFGSEVRHIAVQAAQFAPGASPVCGASSRHSVLRICLVHELTPATRMPDAPLCCPSPCSWGKLLKGSCAGTCRGAKWRRFRVRTTRLRLAAVAAMATSANPGERPTARAIRQGTRNTSRGDIEGQHPVRREMERHPEPMFEVVAPGSGARALQA